MSIAWPQRVHPLLPGSAGRPIPITRALSLTSTAIHAVLPSPMEGDTAFGSFGIVDLVSSAKGPEPTPCHYILMLDYSLGST